MVDETVSIAELEDKQNTVYLIGISREVPQSVADWLYSDKFEFEWNQEFVYADYLLMPAMFDGVVQLEAESVDEVREELGIEEVEDDSE